MTIQMSPGRLEDGKHAGGVNALDRSQVEQRGSASIDGISIGLIVRIIIYDYRHNYIIIIYTYKYNYKSKYVSVSVCVSLSVSV